MLKREITIFVFFQLFCVCGSGLFAQGKNKVADAQISASVPAGSVDLSKIDYNHYSFPFYTGKVFPKAKQAVYSDRFIPLARVVIITGPKVKKDDARLTLLTNKLRRWGSTIHRALDAAAATQIMLDVPGQGDPAPKQAEGYSLNCVERNGQPAIAINSNDAQGLLWGIVSFLQLVKRGEPASPVWLAAAISDYPDNPKRGMLSHRWAPAVYEFMLFNKLNQVIFQFAYIEQHRQWRKSQPTFPEVEWYGAIFHELGLSCYYGLHPVKTNGATFHPDTFRCADENDYKILAGHADYLARHHLGFYLGFDDFRFPLHPDDIKKFGTAKEADVYLVNRLYGETKKTHPDFQMVFCPPFYWGPTAPHPYPEDREAYLTALGQRLDKSIDIFWTGPRVKSSAISAEQVKWITEKLGRKPLLFQNLIGSPHMNNYSYATDPLPGWNEWYDRNFYQSIGGYMVNSHGANHAFALATNADCVWNRQGYQPPDSIRQAVNMLAGPGAFAALDMINKKLSYFDQYGRKATPAAALKLAEMEKQLRELNEAYAAANKEYPEAIGLTGFARYIAAENRFVADLKKNPNLKKYSALDEKIRADAQKETTILDGDILLTPSAFIGGLGHTYYAHQCPPRYATWIYGKKTAYSKMAANFECSPFPPEKDYELIISGQDDEEEGECRIAVLINDEAVYSGPSGFVKKGWSIRKLKIPAKFLKRYNTITFVNLEDSDHWGPPYFILNYALLKK